MDTWQKGKIHGKADCKRKGITYMSTECVAGRNSVMEALKSGRAINKLLIAKGEKQGSIRDIIGLAREKGLIVQEVDAAKLLSLIHI